ncbi:MAG: MgtC/SapB family protein [Erysipelotrichaceae bacterium]|nr:MgtC/SapB family protein [Erysipelotrichaceae bacterium]
MSIHEILPYATVSFQILYATLMGALIGYDREVFGKPAGIKTHAMVCLGSCLVMLIGTLTFKDTNLGDPMRMAAQVVSGMGFLCGGVIIVTHNNEIKGLTTAAGLWFAACMGLCIGSSFMWMSVPAGLCYFFITHTLAKMERSSQRIQRKKQSPGESEKEKIVS